MTAGRIPNDHPDNVIVIEPTSNRSDDTSSDFFEWHSKPFVRPLRTSDYCNRPLRTSSSLSLGFDPQGLDDEEPDLVHRNVQDPEDTLGLARLPYDASTDFSDFQPGHRGFEHRFLRWFHGDEVVETVYHSGTELLDFLSRELTHEDSVLDFSVLTGLARSPWATTCKEYMSAVWPNSSESIDMMVKYLRYTALNPRARISEDSLYIRDPSGPIQVLLLPDHHSHFGHQGLSFKLKGRPETCAPLVEAVSWLCSALRTSSTSVLEKSKVDITPLSKYELLIISLPTIPIGVVPNACWMPLVPCTTTAIDFPVPLRRPDMRGMEVSFDFLCHLCGLEYAVIEDDGIVLYGERSIVYPVRKGGDSVQWHFEPREPLSAGSESIDLPTSRLKVDDLDALREEKRHFLGLWAESQVTLGTSIQESRIFSSNSPELERELTPDGITIGGSINVLPRIISGTLQRTYKYAQNRRSIFCADFEAKMHSLINVPVLLYSPSERRCWMVPYLNVIYHLARVRAEHQQTLGVEIPPCGLAVDGGQAVFEIIQSYCHNPFRGNGFDWDERQKARAAAVVAHIDQIWAILDCASRNTHKVKKYFRTHITGYEMADIARARIQIRMKRHRLQALATGWTPLLNEVPLVLFYEGLSDPIIPHSNQGFQSACTRTMWQRIPRGFGLLTATIPCLRYLAEEHNDRDILAWLTRRHQWHCPGNRAIFTSCGKNTAHHCDRLQELKACNRPLSNAVRSPRASSYRRHPFGAVVFRYRESAQEINRSSATSTNTRRRRETGVVSGQDTPTLEPRVRNPRYEENVRGTRRRKPKQQPFCVLL